PFTDGIFTEAAIEWLIDTDQPIDALTHPKLKVMIDIAARATESLRASLCPIELRQDSKLSRPSRTK
ncbi:hypothetical protein B0H13DRAFT_1637687, partial [Mycena leptocephala]